MKKLLLTLALQMFFWAVVYGQTDDPGCSVAVSVSDQGCSTSSDCELPTGCTESNVFQVVCNGTGWLKIQTSCPAGSCDNCAVCAKVVTAGTGEVVFECDNLDRCGRDCCFVCTDPNFHSGTYKLRVCLIACPDGNETACCAGLAPCTANATFSTNSLSCP
jgi:hypothetical protein